MILIAACLLVSTVGGFGFCVIGFGVGAVKGNQSILKWALIAGIIALLCLLTQIYVVGFDFAKPTAREESGPIHSGPPPQNEYKGDGFEPGMYWAENNPGAPGAKEFAEFVKCSRSHCGRERALADAYNATRTGRGRE